MYALRVSYTIIIIQLLKEIEKPIMDFKESQKKERKEVGLLLLLLSLSA